MNQDNLTTALYFISTVPQVLGAMLALLGVFVILRLEALKREIFSVSQEIIDKQKFEDLEKLATDGVPTTTEIIGKEIENLKRNQISGSIVGLSHNARILKGLMQSDPILESYIPNRKWLEIRCKRISNGRNKFDTFRKVTKQIFIVNGIILALFILSFLFIQNLIHSPYPYYLTLIIGITLTIFSLITMINFVLHSVSNRIQKSILDIRWNKKRKRKK